MDATTYIKQRQMLWARRHEIEFELRNNGGYVRAIKDNLFEPLTEQAQVAYGEGAGDELSDKMLALHSSSALAANVFGYWMRLRAYEPIAKALELPASGIVRMDFEVQHAICRPEHPEGWRFKKPAHLDVEIRYSGSTLKAVAIESKFDEPYHNHQGLSETYLKVSDLWQGLPQCEQLARRLASAHPVYKHLDAAQLLKHVLSLRACHGTSFRLVYLTYSVPTTDTHRHHEEIDSFTTLLQGDGIQFQHSTYQELILGLASQPQLRRDHQPYLDYLAERYL